MDILAQSFAVLGKTIESFGLLLKNKLKMFIVIAIAGIGYVTSFLLLGSVVGAIANTITAGRYMSYYLIETHNPTKKKYGIAIILQISIIVTTVVLFWRNAYDLIIIVSVVLQAFGTAYKNTLVVRFVLIINNFLWFVFNFMLGAYINCGLEIIAMIAGSFGIIIHHYLPYFKIKRLNKITGVNVK